MAGCKWRGVGVGGERTQACCALKPTTRAVYNTHTHLGENKRRTHLGENAEAEHAGVAAHVQVGEALRQQRQRVRHQLVEASQRVCLGRALTAAAAAVGLAVCVFAVFVCCCVRRLGCLRLHDSVGAQHAVCGLDHADGPVTIERCVRRLGARVSG